MSEPRTVQGRTLLREYREAVAKRPDLDGILTRYHIIARALRATARRYAKQRQLAIWEAA